MEVPNFFAELKRRNVYKVAGAYAIVSRLIGQRHHRFSSTLLVTRNC